MTTAACCSCVTPTAPNGIFPWRETIEGALAQKLKERLGILLAGKPELFGIYSNFHVLPSDHVMLFIEALEAV